MGQFLQVPHGAEMHNLFKVATRPDYQEPDKPDLLIV
jgi:hypothetical protein